MRTWIRLRCAFFGIDTQLLPSLFFILITMICCIVIGRLLCFPDESNWFNCSCCSAEISWSDLRPSTESDCKLVCVLFGLMREKSGVLVYGLGGFTMFFGGTGHKPYRLEDCYCSWILRYGDPVKFDDCIYCKR
jgi:hypothetical protein